MKPGMIKTFKLNVISANIPLMYVWWIYYLWHLLARRAGLLHRNREVNEDAVVKCFSQRTRAGCALTDPPRASVNRSNLRVTQRLKLIFFPPVQKSPRTWFFQACIYLYLHYANVVLAGPEMNIFAFFFILVFFNFDVWAQDYCTKLPVAQYANIKSLVLMYFRLQGIEFKD